jgi:hypothetical protein
MPNIKRLHSFGDPLNDVDWTSVAGFGIEAGLASPDMSRLSKVIASGIAALDASTDISVNYGVESVANGKKAGVAVGRWSFFCCRKKSFGFYG